MYKETYLGLFELLLYHSLQQQSENVFHTRMRLDCGIIKGGYIGNKFALQVLVKTCSCHKVLIVHQADYLKYINI